MNTFSRWPILNRCLQQGLLQTVDLMFAASVLKRGNNEAEEHAALLSILLALSRQGHLCLDLSELEVTLPLLGIEDVASFSALLLRGAETFPSDIWIHRLGNCLYLQKNWICESDIALHLERLRKTPPAIPISSWDIDPRLNEAQAQAVKNGIENSLSFLTGGPGTGKTFTAAELVIACVASLPLEERKRFRIILTAPTGKAVAQLEGNLKKVLDPNVKMRTGTLHAILGIKVEPHVQEIVPLFADLIIVDECSMIDAKIFARLLSSVQGGTRLILIGDKDQLPPVEAGSIFADLLDICPSTRLTECLRSDRAEILHLSSLVKEGKADAAIQFLLENNQIAWTDLEEENKTPHQLCADLWLKYKDRFSSHSEGSFSLLSCMRQGPLGVDAINRYFLHQSLKEVTIGALWTAPIMITRNDYALDLYNGDLGFLIRKITPDFLLRQFHIEDYAVFPDRKGGFRQIAALALTSFEYSYCLSVHKSQGSEYDEALILMPRGSEHFGREVLYTAITRAKSKVALAGSQELLRQAITFSSRKISGLSARLKLCQESSQCDLLF